MIYQTFYYYQYFIGIHQIFTNENCMILPNIPPLNCQDQYACIYKSVYKLVAGFIQKYLY